MMRMVSGHILYRILIYQEYNNYKKEMELPEVSVSSLASEQITNSVPVSSLASETEQITDSVPATAALPLSKSSEDRTPSSDTPCLPPLPPGLLIVIGIIYRP